MMEMNNYFRAADYAVFAVIVVFSIAIGIYFALRSGKHGTINEYLLAGRKMRFVPVALSAMVTYQSSIMMLGTPAEAYVYGLQWILAPFAIALSRICCTFVLVPVLYPLKLTSVYEYLEQRFDSRAVQLTGSVIGIISIVWYMAVVLYGQGVALQAVTGLSEWLSVFVVSLAAVAYTSVGGLKAVVWTDVFQCIVMFTGIFAILIKGTIDAGGANEVWTRAYNGGRMNILNFDPDLTTRHTFWNLTIGNFIRSLGFVFNQSALQRIAATPTLKDAKRVMFLMVPTAVLILILALMEGVVAYGYYDYKGCDPLESKQISNSNQVILELVMDIFRNLPGMPGVFLAALFSASLSTVSSGLSSLSAITWKGFVEPHMPNCSEFKATIIVKCSVVVYGLICCALAAAISRIQGTLSQVSSSLASASDGPLVGIFLLGLLCPWANKKGALVGGLTSFFLLSWINLGASFSPTVKRTPWLPAARTDQCPVSNWTYMSDTHMICTTLNFTVTENIQEAHGINRLYQLSYNWYDAVAYLTVLIVGTLISLLTGGNRDAAVDRKYLVPVSKRLYCCMPMRVRMMFRRMNGPHKMVQSNLQGESVDQELQKLKLDQSLPGSTA